MFLSVSNLILTFQTYWIDSSNKSSRVIYKTLFHRLSCLLSWTFNIPVCFSWCLLLFVVHFLTVISCWSSVMIHPSPHKTPNAISRAVIIFGIIWICLAFFIRPGIWSVAIYEDYVVLPYASLSVMFFDIITGSVVCVVWLDRCKFAPEYAIASVYLLGELVGVPILLIKLILGVLIKLYILFP